MRGAAAAACALLCAACSCDPLEQNGTAVRVRVDIEAEIDVTQLRFSLTHDGGALFQPVVRPETAGARLASGGSLLVLVDDTLAGQTVDCSVTGLSSGEAVAEANGSAVVVRGREVPCPVSLLPGESCGPANCTGCCANGTCVGGTDNAACGASGASCFACDVGQHCVAGGCACDVTSCGGCCSGNVCLDGGAPLACGKGGLQCASCASGQTCDDGVCGCDGGACGGGCSPSTCASGCCSGDMCLGSGVASCGLGAALCVDCRTSLSDTCLNGSCSCGGDGGMCPSTQHCVGGACVCDSSVCPSGCCSNGACVSATAAACGAGGHACTDCRTVTTDACRTDGGCGCGVGGPCAAGLHCLGGQCVCDNIGCAGGCCQGNQCYAPPTKQHCGLDGGTCKSCSGGSQCTAAGTCQ